jgi:hypothetical protein
MENIIYDENTKRKRKCKIFFVSSGFSVGNTVAVNHPTPFVLSMSKDEWHSGQALRLSKPVASFIELGDLGELTETPQPNLPASALPSSSDSNL